MSEALDSFTVYYETVRVALEDDIVSGDESAILSVVRSQLGLGQQDHVRVLEMISNSEKPGEGDPTLNHARADQLYEQALQVALADSTITEDEWALLDIIRLTIAITETEHQQILGRIQARLGQDEARNRLARLQEFLDQLHSNRQQPD